MPRVVGGFSVGQFTPENVLRNNGLDTRATVDQLVAAAAPHDATNPGYLSEAELQKGAADLLVSLAGAPTTTTTTTTDSFDYSRAVLSNVKSAMLTGNPSRTFSDAEVIAAAAQWDDGNGYLKKKEIEAGAMELQITSTGAALKSSDIAAIRSWTGCDRKGSTPVTPPPSSAREIGVVSDIDKTLMPPEQNGVEPPSYPGVSTLFTLLERGPQGTGALGDVTYVTARNPGRVTTIDAWLARNNLPAGTIETGTVSFPLNVAEDNKVADIEKILRANPTQSFVMFGDTNHRDPEVYTRIRAAFPSQVTAVIMHDVKTINATRVAGHELVKNYAEAAAKLFKLKVIDEAGARSVMNAAKNEGLAITDAQIDALIASHR